MYARTQPTAETIAIAAIAAIAASGAVDMDVTPDSTSAVDVRRMLGISGLGSCVLRKTAMRKNIHHDVLTTSAANTGGKLRRRVEVVAESS